MHRYKPSTAGERLCHYIHEQLDDERAWRYLLHAIRAVGDSDKLTTYYRHHAALFLTCKLISAGRSVAPEQGENSSGLLPVVERFPWNHLNSRNKLLRLLESAVAKSGRPISPGVASEMRAYARAEHGDCYICGTSLDFTDSTSRSYYTADHLWPSSFGGDSIEENLLPACSDCNRKKGDVATWVSTDVHSLFLGFNPDVSNLSAINFKRRYALYHRAAMSFAIQRETTLKQAFLRLGPWSDPRVYDTDLAADMFNLMTHEESEHLEVYETL